MFRRCPSCHWIFQAKEIKRELLGADKLQKAYPFAPAPMKLEWQDSFEKEQHVHIFQITFKCKHCGYQWNSLVQKKQ